MSLIKKINSGPEAWKYLKGIFCVYKPRGLPSVHVRNTLCFNLCRGMMIFCDDIMQYLILKNASYYFKFILKNRFK